MKCANTKCGKEFLATRRWQKFCSRHCQNTSLIKKRINAQTAHLDEEIEKLKKQNESFKETIKRQSDRIMDLINELEIAKEEISKLRDAPPMHSHKFESLLDKYIRTEFRYYEPKEVEVIRTFASHFTHYLSHLGD